MLVWDFAREMWFWWDETAEYYSHWMGKKEGIWHSYLEK